MSTSMAFNNISVLARLPDLNHVRTWSCRNINISLCLFSASCDVFFGNPSRRSSFAFPARDKALRGLRRRGKFPSRIKDGGPSA